MHALPHNLYRAAEVRELDRIVIEEHGVPGAVLMERAGAGAFEVLRACWPEARRITVVCGSGNNGGDGYVLARLAQEAGCSVTVYRLGDADQLRGDARTAERALAGAGLEGRPFRGQSLRGADVVVDAVFGTGLDRDVAADHRAAVEAINDSGAAVLALDIPSGLHADSGRCLGVAVVADVTVTFIGLKQGLFTACGPECRGVVYYRSLDVPQEVFSRVPPASLRLSLDTMAPLLRPRRRAAHKGDHGHVLIVGGDHGMIGAARLAGEAAGRSGAGLVSIATRAAHAPLLSVARPELMAHGVETVPDLRALACRASVVAVGPGLGRSSWARHMLGTVLELDLPLVVDADGLNLLAAEPARRDNWVLTPHPGEAGRLLASSAADVQADRFQAVSELQRRYGGVIVLKGAGSLVCDQDGSVGLCGAGNPGMASGGMGDVLTGVVAGLLAQGLDHSDAACLGTLLHAQAGDRAAAIGGERGLLASDLLIHLQHCVNPVVGSR